MKPLESIIKKEDGTRLRFKTYIWSEMRDDNVVKWSQYVEKSLPGKRKFIYAKKGIDYTEEDLRNERLKFAEELKKSI
ncbi:hypothetical protein [Chryseobacterium bernardetii]|uniref:hypothetical protein n=1 Tax=Chryseobacterium bernardetii TaxID=1241978 RepID=UPI0016298C65|nr:hypothetical protein [Chryseobacterium bernardetii]